LWLRRARRGEARFALTSVLFAPLLGGPLPSVEGAMQSKGSVEVGGAVASDGWAGSARGGAWQGKLGSDALGVVTKELLGKGGRRLRTGGTGHGLVRGGAKLGAQPAPKRFKATSLGGREIGGQLE
jgi:hypothetical protein